MARTQACIAQVFIIFMRFFERNFGRPRIYVFFARVCAYVCVWWEVSNATELGECVCVYVCVTVG